MIVLDTIVVSELMRASPEPAVVAWVKGQAPGLLHTTSVAQAEILHGIALLPDGRRRRAIEAVAESVFADEFGGRVLAFDSLGARHYARITSERRRAGKPISQFDAQIAAIAAAAEATLATRNVADFAGCGVKIVNPWAFKAPRPVKEAK